MKIPKSFYIRFWLKNSTMAVATAFLLGLMLARASHFFLFVFAVPICALVVYQYAVQQYFWGKRRGSFEYAYREWLVRKATNSLFLRTLGIRGYIRLYLDELSALGSVREDIYKSLQGKEEIIQNEDHKFYLYLRIAENALKESSFDREIEYLRKAVSSRANDLIANYRLGNALERTGDGPGAIRAYEAAFSDPLAGKELKELILAQIRRVERLGPSIKPPMLGFHYMSW